MTTQKDESLLTPFVQNFLLRDGAAMINKVGEDSLSIFKEMSNFFKKLQSIEEIYAHSLEKLYQSSLQAKINWKLSKKGGSLSGYSALIEETHKIAECHSAFASRLQQSLIPILDDHAKTYKESKKQITTEAQQITKELKDSYAFLQKTKNGFVDANVELENATNSLETLKAKPQAKSEEVLKSQAKVIQQKDKLEKADEEYKKSIESANTKQKLFYTEKMPRLLVKFELLEEDRCDRWKNLLMNQHCLSRLEIPPLSKSAFEFSFRTVEEIDVEIEILHKAEVYNSSPSGSLTSSTTSAGNDSPTTSSKDGESNSETSTEISDVLNLPSPFVYEPFSSETKRPPPSIGKKFKSIFAWNPDSSSGGTPPSSSPSSSANPSLSSSTSGVPASSNPLASISLASTSILPFQAAMFVLAGENKPSRASVIESYKLFKKPIDDLIAEQNQPSSEEQNEDGGSLPLSVISSPNNLSESTKQEIVLPSIFVALLLAILKNKGEEAEGIFRVPASTDDVRQLKLNYDKGVYTKDEIPEVSPFVPGSLLKLWLRELPIPLIPNDLYSSFVDNSNDPQIIENLISEKMPIHHKNVLLTLLAFLQRLASPAVVQKTRMGKENLAMVFAPCILRCPFENEELIKYAGLETNLTLTLLKLNLPSTYLSVLQV